MQVEVVLGIVGAFLVVVGSINAFFLKGIFNDLAELKVGFARMIVLDETKEARIKELEDNQKEILEKINNLEKELLR